MSRCDAICEDFENGKRYNLRRVIVTPAEKRCSRHAKFFVKVGHGWLNLCNTHKRLHDEGFVDAVGRVTPKSDIAAERNARARAIARRVRLSRGSLLLRRRRR